MDDSMKARAHTLFQQTLLGDAAEHAEVGVMVWNEELRYVAVNNAACALLGITREQLLGARVGDHNQTDAARDAIAASLEGRAARGRVGLPNGRQVEWMTVPSDVAGLPHIFGLMWEAASESQN